ncbi:MAG: protein translocase subunit SecD [Anaerolineae bacterium]|nr:protein translocase subunit SecD [Anaerolineae bacterium]
MAKRTHHRKEGLTRNSFIAISLLAVVAIYLVAPFPHPEWLSGLLFWRPEGMRSLDFQLGLDLRGGIQVLLVADLEPGQELEPGAMGTARRIIENRVNALGLTEPVVQIQGTDRIVVEIPGVDNPAQAVATIRETSLLEFVEPPSGISSQSLAAGNVVRTTYAMTDTTPITSSESVTQTPLFTTILAGGELERAYATRNSTTSEPVVAINFTKAGTRTFADYTATHVGKVLCMVLDKEILSCPRINTSIPDGRAVIKGNFTMQSAEQLALQLQYGALPVPLRIESYESIGPSLGSIAVEKSIRAGAVGLAVVFIFMLLYYRFNGLAADLALALYVVLNLLVYKLIPVTLTLPGIAGFLLSVGMAVDANILVFERMKEEVRRGATLNRAAESGFSRAWTSVRDSNIATLLTCFILYMFGSAFAASLVKGFAIALALGTLINLFTAIVVTRTLIRMILGVLETWLQDRPWLLGLRRGND